MDGVVSSSVGYTGGPSAKSNPTYRSVCSGDGHTEAIRVVYDPKVLSYEQLMQRVLKEASSHRSKPQYMSAVWAQNPSQAAAASKVAASLNKQSVPILKAADTSDRTADFGSIRFPGSRRPLPSKYARVARSTADLTAVSNGESQVKEGEWFTSIRNGRIL